MKKDRDEFELPRAVVERVARAALPENVHLSKDAKVALSKSVKAFILYITDLANSYCEASNRATLLAGDVMKALEVNEFKDIFDEDLQQCIEEYEKAAKQKQPTAKRKREATDGAGPAEEEGPKKRGRKVNTKEPKSFSTETGTTAVHESGSD
mmetsp:Transcript_10320/g.28983  ORF Transcript_10320/g.28983 Transcript_10320/m.28983 type:complete len:153 (-) Transcript_10320:158-616(-)